MDASQIAMLPPRTIFQVLCPALAGVISPFTHDMAARRSAMLDLPVFAGDNAEVGVLLSVASEFGTNAIGQVELGHAHPAPPPQPGLRSALDLLQVMSRRLTDPKCEATLRGWWSGYSMQSKGRGPTRQRKETQEGYLRCARLVLWRGLRRRGCCRGSVVWLKRVSMPREWGLITKNTKVKRYRGKMGLEGGFRWSGEGSEE